MDGSVYIYSFAQSYGVMLPVNSSCCPSNLRWTPHRASKFPDKLYMWFTCMPYGLYGRPYVCVFWYFAYVTDERGWSNSRHSIRNGLYSPLALPLLFINAKIWIFMNAKIFHEFFKNFLQFFFHDFFMNFSWMRQCRMFSWMPKYLLEILQWQRTSLCLIYKQNKKIISMQKIQRKTGFKVTRPYLDFFCIIFEWI